ncbi:hypothetical protein ACVIHI_001637 [Bradyrhizobium sp. USDA 4524]|uniref:hypothetical protein n=1 Tax=Bradyrhizobium TaxID=374 RepID=UPI001CE289AC|nr:MULTISPECIES: hypothetical protein [Bradyrhizobium]MCA6103814.1 hypothetical protein [Bradyrhizobium australafricanum]MCP1845443.1 hypothetical protein [Bradyrhizobium sp. USDA 4538]MCP1906007.1 hypothetical protein [Bradyrhizobium sp. USDA 4537]MCP1988338.1 hypothetical protein [Bradyrhizobium sp. USDA 4539]
MGALIRTVGTRMLIQHFNHEFCGSRLNDIRTQHPMVDPKNQLIQEYFKTDKDLLWLTNNIKHGHARRPDNKCFLPVKNKDKAAPNAISRWTWFIDKANISGLDALTAANHVAVCDAIYTGLTGASSTGGRYDRIEFDAIDGTSVKGAADQFVLQAEETDPDGAKYYKVILVTPPIPAAAGGGRPKKDDQPGDP